MHRFDGTGNQAGLFTDGDPSAGIEASIPDQAIMNAMQEETVNVIGAGNLSKGNNRQLMTSIAILAATAAPNSVTAYNNDPVGTRRLFGDTIWQKSAAGANGWTAVSYVIPTTGTSRIAAGAVGNDELANNFMAPVEAFDGSWQFSHDASFEIADASAIFLTFLINGGVRSAVFFRDDSTENYFIVLSGQRQTITINWPANTLSWSSANNNFPSNANYALTKLTYIK